MKIHFLEELLRKSDPNLNQNALKENTDLRVDRATLQRDLAKVRKQLTASARDTDHLRQQLVERRKKSEQDLADEQQRQDVAVLREIVHNKEIEIERLQSELDLGHDVEELQKQKETIEDLEMTLREKERVIDSHDEEKVDPLKRF